MKLENKPNKLRKIALCVSKITGIFSGGGEDVKTPATRKHYGLDVF